MSRPGMRSTSLVLAVLMSIGVWFWVRKEPLPTPATTKMKADAGGARIAGAPIRLSAGEAAPLDDSSSSELAGRVLSSASGQGIGGAELTFDQNGAAVSVVTDGTGAFRWRVPSAGRYQLSMIAAKGYEAFAPAYGHSPVVFEARPGVRLHNVTLFLSPLVASQKSVPDGGTPHGKISGQVVDAFGAGQDNALVVAYQHDEVVARTTSDGAGRFSLDGLGDSAHTVVASHRGWVPATAEAVRVGTADLLLTLGRGGRIVGSVREKESGKPVVAFSIVAIQHKGAVERGESITSSFFSGDGHYELTGVAPGRYSVVAIAQDRARSDEQKIELINFTSEMRADFVLARGASLKGRVVDAASNQGLAGARVSLENPFGADTSMPLPVVASAATDASGAFSLSGLSPGTCSLFVTAEGHHSRVVPGVPIDPDQSQPVTIDLTATKPGEASSIESAGINAAVEARGDQLLISRISPGGAAELAGIKNGDIIVRVAGVAVADLGMQAAVERLRGPPGTTVVVTLRRPPNDADFDLTVERKRIINR